MTNIIRLKFLKSLVKKIYRFMLVLKGLYCLMMDKRLGWLIRFVQYRYKYISNALYAGMQMNRNEHGNLYNFRRNIHRIEKGLIYKQSKGVFAEDYILETVNYLAQLKSSCISDKNTIDWGEAVLNQYFKATKHTEKITKAYALYQKLAHENRQPTWFPYQEKKRPKLAVEYEAFYQLALRRRSIRHYLDKTVDFDVIKKAMNLAILSPSACNRQAFKFLFYNDKAIVKEISNMTGGITGYEVPSIIVVVGNYRGYFDERDVNAPIVDASLAIMAFIFALETLGLSSVCINWPALPDQDKSIRQLIHLENDEFIVLLIGVGYPDPEGKIPYSGKMDADELILCNERIRSQVK